MAELEEMKICNESLTKYKTDKAQRNEGIKNGKSYIDFKLYILL